MSQSPSLTSQAARTITETNPVLLLFASVFWFYLAFILCLFQVEFTPDQIEGEEDVFLFFA